MNTIRTTLPVILAAALLAACAAPGLPETVLPPRIDYACQQGTALTVLRSPDGRQADAIHQGRRMVLPRIDSAAQEKYGNGRITLYLDGENALLTEDSMVLAGRCTSMFALPVAPKGSY
jgi:membrane-bound inhibitor of C-type lysozyme